MDNEELTLTGYEGLCASIVKSAVHDIVSGTASEVNRATAITFLKSDWCYQLTGIPKEYWIKKIKKLYGVDI